MKNRLINIGHGIFIIIGTSVTGLMLGIYINGMVGGTTENPSYLSGLIWPVITAIGLLTGFRFAISKKEMP